MRNTFYLFTLLIGFGCFAQKFEKQTKPIVEEGKRLYKSEMASWYGTDIFIEKYTKKENIGGYFSYSENDRSKCIFFSKETNPKVIGTISFDDTFNTQTANTDLSEREFTTTESDLYSLRLIAKNLILADTLFKHYENSNLNIIPIISNEEKKVYVLTGPEKSGVVIFGNDYLITFDKQNNIKNKKQLHKNIIPINYAQDAETIHNHQSETGDFITATDVCTLMLYERYAKWKNHIVVSEKYASIWDCKTNNLFVMTTKAIEKISHEENKK